MTKISIETIIRASIEKVWERYTNPEYVVQWNHASDDWHSPKGESDLRVGGKFNYRMEAKDGSFGFDFWGTYDEVRTQEYIAYTMGDGRKVEVHFTPQNDQMIKVTVVFEVEQSNSVEMQRNGWQAILDNFKKYTEAEN